MPVIAALFLAAALGAEPQATEVPAAVAEAPAPAVEAPAVSTGPSLAFDRVDLISEDPGTWLNDDLPMVKVNGIATALRFVTQIKTVIQLPVENLYLGLSLQSQSLAYEAPLVKGGAFFWSVALQTRYLMPTGAFAGLAWRCSRIRLAAGVSAASSASWARPNWSHWSVVPTLGIGVGRAFEGG